MNKIIELVIIAIVADLIMEEFQTRKITSLIMQNEKKDKKIEELTKENARLTGQLDKIRNYIKMTTGVDILEGE